MKYIKTLSLSALALLAVSCGNKSEEKAEATQAQGKVQVKIAKVTSADIPQTETYTATVESDVKQGPRRSTKGTVGFH